MLVFASSSGYPVEERIVFIFLSPPGILIFLFSSLFLPFNPDFSTSPSFAPSVEFRSSVTNKSPYTERENILKEPQILIRLVLIIYSLQSKLLHSIVASAVG